RRPRRPAACQKATWPRLSAAAVCPRVARFLGGGSTGGTGRPRPGGGGMGAATRVFVRVGGGGGGPAGPPRRDGVTPTGTAGIVPRAGGPPRRPPAGGTAAGSVRVVRFGISGWAVCQRPADLSSPAAARGAVQGRLGGGGG